MSDKIHVQSLNAPNGWSTYTWETTESVIAMPEQEALQLLRIPHSGFFQAEDYDARPKAKVSKASAKKAAASPPAPEYVVVEKEPTAGLGTALDLVTPKG